MKHSLYKTKKPLDCARKNFEKPSVKRRAAKMKAIYVQHLQLLDEQ